MSKGTAESYWANTAEAYFDSMGSTYRPGSREEAPAARGRQTPPPLTPSQNIMDAIAACQPGRQPARASQVTSVVSSLAPSRALQTV